MPNPPWKMSLPPPFSSKMSVNVQYMSESTLPTFLSETFVDSSGIDLLLLRTAAHERPDDVGGELRFHACGNLPVFRHDRIRYD